MLKSLFCMNIFAQIGIIALLIVIFLLVYILNHRTKAPKGVELPEKCSSCTSSSCMIKLKDVEEIKKELKAELEKCENNDSVENKQEEK